MFDAKYVIIGGGIAGTVAAEVLRREDKGARIIIVCDEPYTLYSRVLLTKPNFFLGKIPFERIFLKDDKWYDDRHIELWRKRRAVRLDHDAKIVALDNGEELHYEKLLLTVGSTPRRLPIPGMDKKGVYTLRTIDQTKKIIDAVKHAKSGVAIGGGVIGFEMAEMMQLSGISVTFIIIKPHYRIGFLGEETSKIIETAIEKTGVKIMRNSETVEIFGGDSVEGVRLKDGTNVACDFVIVGVGTTVPADFLKDAGIEVNRGILANEYLETNISDIWTAGDCAEYYDSIIEDTVSFGNWANAQAQGQIAAKNMLGRKKPYKHVSFFTTHGFGKAMTYVGDVRQNKEGRIVILRGSPKDDTHARIVIENNRVVGALIINSSREVDGFCKLIEGKVDVSEKLDQLKDPGINPKTLLS